MDLPSIDWMNESLEAAKAIITKFHALDGLDDFFKATTYSLFIQTDKPNAYGYIRLAKGASNFPIGIHTALAERDPRNQRMIVVVLVHELLHALHPDWGHDKINPLEKLLANKAGYFDSLVELQNLAVSGKLRICNS